MNADRRQVIEITLALLVECSHTGLIGDDAHLSITNALGHLSRQEFHQLRTQEKFEGKNASTDKQVAICRVALPALEAAVEAWNNDDFEKVIDRLKLAASTDGTPPKATRTRRKARA